MDLEKIRLFEGGACSNLAEQISRHLGIPLSGVDIKPFKDGERFVKLEENVRGMHVFFIQSTQPPADNLMQLLVMIDAAKRASAKEITSVIPYFGCARQERKKEGRVPITASLIADLLATAGADRVVTVELHSAAIQGFFHFPCDHLYMSPVMVPVIKDIISESGKEIALCSTDINGGKIVRALERKYFPQVRTVIVDKDRAAHGVSNVAEVNGDPAGCVCIMVDDMIDGGGSMVNTEQALRDKGAIETHAIATHPVFSGEAVQKLEASPIKSVHVGDTIPIRSELAPGSKIKIHSFGSLIGDAIRAIAEETSVSEVCFEER